VKVRLASVDADTQTKIAWMGAIFTGTMLLLLVSYAVVPAER
jgi:hypothetical protein